MVLKRDGVDYLGLLIGRNSPRIWSLPKGHVEPHETIEQAATREVKEETGIDATIVAGLSDIRYWFYSDRVKHNKVVHFYLMRYLGGLPTPQLAEVDETAWFPLPDLPSVLTHLNERRLIGIAQEIVFQNTPAELGFQ
ncbi:MAG: NUDIX hydrolase [Candidatus Eremiobacteraeota bacterium]|nr:NUDIX hydrolase [Candidatus Eremiobacteraeota bacterium]MBC5828097.1 NUDIX hydrolase [Candidatus Eremiobacteraeota bacterium]